MTASPEIRERALAALAKARVAQQRMYATQRATNPWGLTAREVNVMRAIVECGSHKLAARKLCLSHRSVSDLVTTIKERMPYETPLLRYLEFDRWIRRECRVAERRLNDLMAVIHGDGGHHREKVGDEQAWKDAIQRVAEMKAKSSFPLTPPMRPSGDSG